MTLVLNFSPLSFEDRELEVELLQYGQDGGERLAALRSEYWQSHVFRREGPNQIAAVSVVESAKRLGKDTKRIKLHDHLGLTASLARNSLLNYLKSIDRRVLAYEPLRFMARDDLLRGSLPNGLACPEWLSVRLLYEVAIRPVYFFKQKPYIAAVVDVRTTRQVARSVADLLAEGFSPVGWYVTRHATRSNDTRIEPRSELLGKVERVNGAMLELSDFKEGVETIDATEAYLEKAAFKACVGHVFKQDPEAILDRLERARANLRSGPTKLDRLQTFIEHLVSRDFELAPGIPFRFGPFLTSVDAASFPQLEIASKPTYIFDQTGAKSSAWHDGGLNQYGPLSSKVFTPNRPCVCVICLKSNKGTVEQFLHKCFNGIPSTSAQSISGKPQKNYFEKGFLRKYGLQDVAYEFFLADDRSANSYKEACRLAIERHGSGYRWDIALVQIEEAFHQLPTQTNPYYIAKESFLVHQIPVQEFEIETARQRDSQLGFTLNNMGLATYAKLDGIPWLLKANPTIAHELVVGLGSANISTSGRLGGRERYVGITTVFSGDGNYHLSNVSRAVTMDEYEKTFLDCLKRAIEKVKQDMNWQPKDHVRLIFHISFKRFRDLEINAVQQLMRDIGDYEVEFAFVQLIEDHPYLLFDKTQVGFKDYETKEMKGKYAPRRASYLHLSNRDVLLCLTGASEIKRPSDGIPSPLLLSLHGSSSFSDMTYLTRQVFAFASHSWRTFLPSSTPVTIQYSDLIAKTLGNLAMFERWNPDVMLGRIGKTRWFL